MDGAPDDRVRRYPPAPPPAGANAPVPPKEEPAQSRTEGAAEPTRVSRREANLPPKEKAEQTRTPGLMGPDSGPAS